VGFAVPRLCFHHLTDEKPQHFGLPRAIVGDRSFVCGQHLGDDRIDRAASLTCPKPSAATIACGEPPCAQMRDTKSLAVLELIVFASTSADEFRERFRRHARLGNRRGAVSLASRERSPSTKFTTPAACRNVRRHRT
jgi:hypothetical protein